MKKLLSCLLAILMAAAGFTACGSPPRPQQSDTLRIVATNFPQYDWMRQILDPQLEQVELILLLNSGVDLHSFQPTVDDITKISACDLFIYVGGESDSWVEDALRTTPSESRVVVKLLDVLGENAKTEELVEGMQPEDDHAHEEEHDGENEHGHEEVLDEHVWLSLKNAQLFCSHLADDYGLQYFAAFPGCSAETEASFETIVFLANKLDELALPAVIALEGSNQSIAKTIVQNTAGKTQPVLALDSMQSITTAGVSAGVTYLSVMQSNLEVLKNALR